MLNVLSDYRFYIERLEPSRLCPMGMLIKNATVLTLIVVPVLYAVFFNVPYQTPVLSKE